MKTVREMAKGKSVVGMRCSNTTNSTQADHCEAYWASNVVSRFHRQ